MNSAQDEQGFRASAEAQAQHSTARRPAVLLAPTLLLTYFLCYLTRQNVAASLAFLGVGMVVGFTIVWFTYRRMRAATRRIRQEQAARGATAPLDPPWPRQEW